MEAGFLQSRVKTRKLSRRRFFFACLAAAPAAVVAEARLFEPHWLKVRRVSLTQSKPAHRFVHFSDLHHKGDRGYAEEVVKTINSLSPEFVCFTGDIVEQTRFLPEALEVLSGIKSPLYGVPGNHDYWCRAPFDGVAKCFVATGGAWLLDEARVVDGGKFNLIGASCRNIRQSLPAANPATKNILLMHYPAWVKGLGDRRFDLMLAGHSHGGQVRIPFHGPLFLPFLVDQYDLGLFETSSGPLYVNAGIGWYPVPLRLNCRPEITVIEI
jgi:predicted MPP superfamily phosphohydrolase